MGERKQEIKDTAKARKEYKEGKAILDRKVRKDYLKQQKWEKWDLLICNYIQALKYYFHTGKGEKACQEMEKEFKQFISKQIQQARIETIKEAEKGLKYIITEREDMEKEDYILLKQLLTTGELSSYLRGKREVKNYIKSYLQQYK